MPFHTSCFAPMTQLKNRTLKVCLVTPEHLPKIFVAAKDLQQEILSIFLTFLMILSLSHIYLEISKFGFAFYKVFRFSSFDIRYLHIYFSPNYFCNPIDLFLKYNNFQFPNPSTENLLTALHQLHHREDQKMILFNMCQR